jgi:hypothetical protein
MCPQRAIIKSPVKYDSPAVSELGPAFQATTHLTEPVNLSQQEISKEQGNNYQWNKEL